MRLNKFLAAHTGLSRRAADRAITEGRVEINQVPAKLGDIVVSGDRVSLDGEFLEEKTPLITIMLHKPVAFAHFNCPFLATAV